MKETQQRGTDITERERWKLYQFVVEEARLADESRYKEWEALWDDTEARYWVPIDEDADPDRYLSYVNDNRKRIHSRIAQLASGNRHAQVPPSILCRNLSNFDFEREDVSTSLVRANFILIEYREIQTIWAGRYVYRIRHGEDGSLRLIEKRIYLVNRQSVMPALTFLI
jgi:3-phenylpropionate/cinnamic acid dioxygenase small subunit